MGTVYLAEHELIKRRVAIKILHPELATDARVIERFMNEARAAGTLGHPNIVESTDMGFTSRHVPYIVFEYLEGTLLTDEIYRVGGLPVRRAVRIAQQIASALHAAHHAGIVHRDLKSDNVFLTDKNDALDHVKVLDFGISRFLETDEEHLVMGTPEFMAPEQIATPAQVDRRTDIYALGVIMFEMLTARRPFPIDGDPRALLHRIVHEPTPPLVRDGVPQPLADLIATRMLAKDPAARFATMIDVDVALDAFTTRGGARRRSRSSTRADATSSRGRAADATPMPGPQSNVLATPWPGPPVVLARRRATSFLLYGLAGAGVVVGGIGLALGMRGRSGGGAPIAVAPPAPPPPPPAAAPAKASVKKIRVQIDADVARARVTFRRRVAAAPASLELTTNDIVELIEVSAPGHKTTRYWVTLDRPTNLHAHLEKGDGLAEASEESTLVALGEVAAPAIGTERSGGTTGKPAAQPAVAVAPPRKIGKISAAEPEDGPTPPIAAAVPAVVPPTPKIDADITGVVIPVHRPEVLRCFAEGKKKDHGMSGTVTLQLAVEPGGKVARAQVQSTLNAPLVAACIAKAASSWRFPARPGDDLTTVSYPFTIH
jgi:serine/threonine-protein kinase